MKRLYNNIVFYLLVIWALILLLRFDLIIDLTLLFAKTFYLLFTNPDFIFSQIDLKLTDFFISYIIYLLVIPFANYTYKKNLQIPRLSSGYLLLFSVIFFSVIAPIISPIEADFYKNINSTKLLVPLSSKDYLVFKSKVNINNSNVDEFLELKRRVFNKSNETNIVYLDSLQIADSVAVYQSGEKIWFAKTDLKLENDFPVIKSRIFILGTDEFGRDIFTRIIYGMRLSLFVASGSVLLCLLFGIVLGYFAGVYGGWIDIFLSRLTDIFLTFPNIFLVVLSIALFGSSLLSVILVLGLSGWMGLYKIVKGEVISIKNKDYFLTAKKIGLNNWQLLLKEIIPVIASPVIINLLLQFSSVILAESALSYLGMGVGLNHPSLGSMINSGQEYFTQAWWLSVFPSVTIIGIILIFNSIGEKINAELNSRLIK